MNLVAYAKFNALVCPDDPIPAAKFWRWCRQGKLPARKIGGEWRVDLDTFNSPVDIKATTSQQVVDKLRPSC